MSGQANKWAVAIVLSAVCMAHAADKGDKDKSKNKKDKKEPTPAELFTPTKEFQEKELKAKNISEQIEAEVAARAVNLPEGMQLDVEWYSPHLNVEKYGKISKGWVLEDLVLLETDRQNLIAVRRVDGVQRWHCVLDGPVRYTPCVSRNNVVVNVNNHLIGINKEQGYVRWKLLPKFVMSCTPLVVDPPAYPPEYTRNWVPLETVYVGGWDGRFYSMAVRGRIGYYTRQLSVSNDLSAPEFDLYYNWHKTPKERGVITSNIVLKDNIIYYSADDHNVSAVTREAIEREPYYLLGTPCTATTVSASTQANVTNSFLNSIYVGATDNSVYCLDRLTLRKKWAYPAGVQAHGTIFSDNAATPYAYVPLENGKIAALQVTPSRSSKGQPEVPESYSMAWETAGHGIITAGQDVVYIGSSPTVRITSRNEEVRAEKEKKGALPSAAEGDYTAYKGISAIEKASGKVLWTVDGAKDSFFSQYLEYHNDWGNPDRTARVFGITHDNRIISLKEKIRDTGIRKVVIPQPEQPAMPVPGKRTPKPEGAAAPAADPAAPAAGEKKKEEPKAEEKK